MQIPILPFRGQRKPWGSIPRINWLHPLARGLVSYGYDAGSGPIDLVTGDLRTITNTARITGNGLSRYGSGLSYVLSNSVTQTVAVTLSGSTPITTATVAAPYTISSGFILNANNLANAAATIYGLTTAGTVQPAVLGTAAVATTDFWFGFADTTINATAAGFATLNTFHTLTGVALTGATTACYVDGKLNISPAVTTTHADATSFPGFCGFDTTATSQSFPGGSFYYGAIWKGRALTAAEAVVLHNDPYCFLIYPEDEMFATMVGASSVTPFNPAAIGGYNYPWSTMGRKVIIIGAG